MLAERDVGGENYEAEGLTVLPMADGSLVHVLDYNKAVGIFLRHYALTEITEGSAETTVGGSVPLTLT